MILEQTVGQRGGYLSAAFSGFNCPMQRSNLCAVDAVFHTIASGLIHNGSAQAAGAIAQGGNTCVQRIDDLLWRAVARLCLTGNP